MNVKRPKHLQKFSMVFVATAEKTQIYPSIEDMPEELRQRLVRNARTSFVDTLVIANEKGRELLQAENTMRQQPQSTESKTWLAPAWMRGLLVLGWGGCLALLIVMILSLR